MKGLRAAFVLGIMLTTACSKTPEEAPAKPGDDAPAAVAATTSVVPRELIGTWQFEGLPLIYKMNSKGRVSLETGTGPNCVGKFTAANGTLSITYDAGQNGCMDGAMPYTIKDDGKTLDFMGAAVYRKLNDTDDTSF